MNKHRRYTVIPFLVLIAIVFAASQSGGGETYDAIPAPDLPAASATATSKDEAQGTQEAAPMSFTGRDT